MSIPNRPLWKVPVMMKNESEHDIVMPQQCIIAELNAIQAILLQSPSSAESMPVRPELVLTLMVRPSVMNGKTVSQRC